MTAQTEGQTTTEAKGAAHQMRLAIAAQWKGIIPAGDGKYIVGVVNKSGNLVVAVAGRFDRYAYKAVVAEALNLGLPIKKMVVYCDLATYSGNSIDVILYADSAITAGAQP